MVDVSVWGLGGPHAASVSAWIFVRAQTTIVLGSGVICSSLGIVSISAENHSFLPFVDIWTQASHTREAYTIAQKQIPNP